MCWYWYVVKLLWCKEKSMRRLIFVRVEVKKKHAHAQVKKYMHVQVKKACARASQNLCTWRSKKPKIGACASLKRRTCACAWGGDEQPRNNMFNIFDDFSVQLTKCQREYQERLKKPSISDYIPHCAPDGKYERVQCENTECFCVDKYGSPLAGTQVSLSEGNPTCNVALRKLHKTFLPVW